MVDYVGYIPEPFNPAMEELLMMDPILSEHLGDLKLHAEPDAFEVDIGGLIPLLRREFM